MKFFHSGYAILFSTLLLVFAVYTLQRKSARYEINEPFARENQSTKADTVPATPTPRVTIKRVEDLGQFLKITKGHETHSTRIYLIKKDAIISIETSECGGGCVKITTKELTLKQNTNANKVYDLPFKSMKEANTVATALIGYILKDQK